MFLRLFTTIVVLLLPALAFAEGLPLDLIKVKGQVRGLDGAGVAGVKVNVEGEAYAAMSDAHGNYELVIPLHEYGDFKSGKKIRIRAKGDKSYQTSTKQAVLALDIKLKERNGEASCELRGNVNGLVWNVGDAIRDGQPEVTVDGMNFLYPEETARRLTMRAEQVVIVGEKKGSAQSMAPPSHDTTTAAAGATTLAAAGVARTAQPAAPKAPAAEAGKEGGAQVRRVGDEEASEDTETTRTSDEVVKMPGPGVKQTDASAIRRVPASPSGAAVGVGALTLADVAATGDGCECRIRGTVELHPDHLLTDRLRIYVSLAQAPSVRDTVELFMGSPRPFELPALRCGDWDLRVEAVSKREFVVVSTDGSRAVSCERGGLQQLRIVLAPQ